MKREEEEIENEVGRRRKEKWNGKGEEKRDEGWYIKLCLGLDATLLPVRGLVDGSLEGLRYNVDTNTPTICLYTYKVSSIIHNLSISVYYYK